MAICNICKREMKTAKSCLESDNAVKIDNKFYIRMNTDEEGNEYGERCHDCGILMEGNNTHHPRCDNEKCPKCGGQIWLGCDCKNIDFASILPKHAKYMIPRKGYTKKEISDLRK